MKKQLAVCDCDRQYCQMMQVYLLKRLEDFDILTFESLEQAAEYGKGQTFAILLVSEALYEEKLQEIKALQTFILREDGTRAITKYPYIEKYQSMERLISSIMMNYSDNAVCSCKNMKKVKLHAFYSPVRKPEQTKAALALGQVLVKMDKKVLYLNLQAFAGWEELLQTSFTADITDLLYFAGKQDGSLAYRLQSMKQTLGGVSYLAPATDYMDLQQLSEKEWLTFLDMLTGMGEYSDIIFDLSEICQGLYRILERSDSIYSISAAQKVQSCAIRQYKRLLEKREHSAILEKTSWLELPKKYFEEAVNMERLWTGQLGEYMKGLVKEHGNRQI